VVSLGTSSRSVLPKIGWSTFDDGWTLGNWKEGGFESSNEVSGVDNGSDTSWRRCAFSDMAVSSTITEGNLPRVYEAVNSHGKPDRKQRAHGHRPEHLVFFL
jgi:hypothetical protein